MKVEMLLETIGAEFFTGVPDSQLRALCDYLMDTYGIDPHRHIIAANEGNAVALAAGYHLATGKIPVVYMQNSGEGNIVNPVASLLDERVYGIPMVFLVGWRGEPGIHDEPQHRFQGEITVKLLEDLEIRPFVIGKETAGSEAAAAMAEFRPLLAKGKSVAFVVRKEALTWEKKVSYHNRCTLRREEAIRHIARAAGTDPIVSTTGKASRELFEIREQNGQSHQYDFLTVGSMGHASSIALGIALNRPGGKVWCIDGDGAALMHMGALAVIGASGADNLIHIVINNGAHETVGGMPTVAGAVDLPAVARACGYPRAVSVEMAEELTLELERAREGSGPCLIDVKCALGARADLGRPTTSTKENKQSFMNYLKEWGGRQR